jgi:ppGpp synthetase/RelA/SpoT-type nucleotidyltranferase
MSLTQKETDLLREMADAAAEPLKDLMGIFATNPVIKRITYTLRSRIKRHTTCIKKVEHKREKKPHYGPESLMDVAGARLVTRYRLDIPDALRTVCDLVATGAHPLKKGQLKEAVIFLTTNAQGKPDASNVDQEVISIIRERFPALHIEEREGTYSGLHVVVRLEADQQENVPAPYEHGIPVEIQIRSVFEDAWAEIDHVAVYKPDGKITKTKGAATNGARMRIEAQVELLKKIVDAAAGHADTIKRMTVEPDSPSSGESGSVTKSLSAATDVGKILDQFGIPRRVSDPLVELVEKREKLFKKLAGRTRGHAKQFDNIAKRLAKIETKEQMPGGLLTKDEDATRALDYYLKMETALAYFYAETPASIQEAVELYSEVVKNEPKSFAARYRLAQAFAKQQKTDDAVDLYVAALDLMDRTDRWSDIEKRFLKTEINTKLKWKTQKLLGFQYYKKSERYAAAKNAKEKMNYLKRAYDTTARAAPACDEDDQKISITNNLLYYAAQYMEVEREHHPNAMGFLAERDLRTLFDKARANLEPGSKPAHYDTVAYVASVLGLQKVALKAAEKVLGLLPSSENTDEENDIMIARAWKIKQANRRTGSKG